MQGTAQAANVNISNGSLQQPLLHAKPDDSDGLQTIELQPGGLGWRSCPSTGKVVEVLDGQAKKAGVATGWRIMQIDGAAFDQDLLTEKIQGSKPYTITFKKALVTQENKRPIIEYKIAEYSNTSNFKLWLQDSLLHDLESLNHFENLYERYHKSISESCPARKIALLHDLAKSCAQLDGLSRDLYVDLAQKIEGHFGGGVAHGQLVKLMEWLMKLNQASESVRRVVRESAQMTNAAVGQEEWTIRDIAAAQDAAAEVMRRNDKLNTIRGNFLAHDDLTDKLCQYLADEILQKQKEYQVTGNDKANFVLRWFLTSLSISVSRKEYAFLNREPTLVHFQDKDTMLLAWTVLGKNLKELAELGVLAQQSLQTNREFAVEMNELDTKVMADFGLKLSQLKGVVVGKIDKVNMLRMRVLAGLMIVVFAFLQIVLSHGM